MALLFEITKNHAFGYTSRVSSYIKSISGIIQKTSGFSACKPLNACAAFVFIFFLSVLFVLASSFSQYNVSFHSPSLALVAADTVNFYPPVREALTSTTNQSPAIHNSIVADNMMVYYPSLWTLEQSLTHQAQPGYQPAYLAGQPTGVINVVSLAAQLPGILLSSLTPHLSYAFTFEAIINLTLAGFFMYLLLRWWRVSVLGSLSMSVIWMFAQHQIVWLMFPAHLRAQLFIPLLFLLFERAFRRPSLWHFLTFGSLLGLTWSVGYTQITSYVLVVLAIYFWFLVATSWRIWLRTAKSADGWLKKTGILKPLTVRILGFSFALALLLASGGWTVLNQAESISQGLRGQQTTQHLPECQVCSWQGWAESLTLFVMPNAFGNHVDHPYSGYKNLVETGRYMTWLPFVLVAVGGWLTINRSPFLRRLTTLQRLQAPFFVVLALLIFLLMQGLPPLATAFYAIPYLNLGQATRMITLVLFLMLAAAGLWFDSVFEWLHSLQVGPSIKRTIIQLAAAGGFLLGIGGGLLLFESGGSAGQVKEHVVRTLQWWFPFFSEYDVRFFLIQGLFAGVILAGYLLWLALWRKTHLKQFLLALVPLLLFGELWFYGHTFLTFSHHDSVMPVTPAVAWLQDHAKEYRIQPAGSVFLPNSHAVYQLKLITGYSTGIPLAYLDWIESAFSSYSTTYNGYLTLPPEVSDVTNQLAAKYVVVEAAQERSTEVPTYPDLVHRTTLDGVHIYENTTVWPRLWWTEELCSPQKCNLKYRAGEDRVVNATAWYRDGATLTLEADQDGTLVLANHYQPHWRLELIDQETGHRFVQSPFAVNTHLTGFLIPAGSYDLNINWHSSNLPQKFQLLVFSLLFLWSSIRFFSRRDRESFVFALVWLLLLALSVWTLTFSARLVEF